MKDEIRKVVKALDKKHPGLVVTKVVDYDNSYYIIEAPESTDEPDMNDPWYAVDKDSFKVFTFTPTADLPKFSKALNSKVIYDITRDGVDTFEEAVEHFLQSDKADVLIHHGILGMKWGHKNGPPYPLDESDHSASEKKAGWKDSLKGAYRNAKKNYYAENIKYLEGPRYRGESDNEYNFRQKQIKTFQDEIAKIDQSNLSDKIRRTFDPRDDYKHSKIVENCKDEIDTIRKDERYQKALDELKPFDKETEDYYNDEKLVNKYQTLAGIISAKDYDLNPDEIVWAYKHEDLDQGTADSFSLYMLDKGVDVKSYNRSLIKAEDNLKNTRETLVKEALGEHYNDVAGKNSIGRDRHVGEVIESAIDRVDNRYAGYIDLIGYHDLDYYEKELSDAKKQYSRYKDI